MRTAASDISMMNIFFLLEALLLVDGVFGVDVKVSLSVMEGDSVTLKPHTEIPEEDSAQWWFGDNIIAQMNKAAGHFSTSKGDDVGFKDRLNLDNQTGYLTITNITNDHTGLYKLKIKTTTEKSKTFSVTVHGNMTTVSVKEGESITLDTGLVEIKGYDLIMWKFKNQLIAGINTVNNTLKYDERFNGRLQQYRQTGSLIISNSRNTDSGDYHLNMSSSSHTVQRTINVTVSGVSDTQTPDPGVSPGVVAGIVVVAVLLAVAGVIYHCWKISKLKRPKDVAENNGTNEFLNKTALEANSDHL
ncbi:hypothetical protein R3I93_016957 [Phoxinus phoxinus]|uniref:Immunoglobulin domain-containing protein n=1 Tax=Phoxinus phoxinus TaxID=58324 RepID=A0AAN9GXP0_9TELE